MKYAKLNYFISDNIFPRNTLKKIRENYCSFGKDFIHYLISLSRHEQVCLSGLRFERYFAHHRPDDGRSISRNVAHLNILVHDVTNLLYYEYWIFTYFIHSFVDSFIPKWFLDNINVSKDIESKEMETLARC